MLVIATPNWNAAGAGGTYLNHAIGVWYDGSRRRWAVFNQDRAEMPDGVAFDIELAGTGALAWVHRATANIAGNSTYLDHPRANANPAAILLVTPNWNPNGARGTYHVHHIGVWYDARVGRWAIFNQDLAAMLAGPEFTSRWRWGQPHSCTARPV